MIPRAVEGKAAAAGINIHDPKYGSWWDKSVHRSKSAEYGRLWKEFFRTPTPPTAAQVLDYARKLAKQYGLTIYF